MEWAVILISSFAAVLQTLQTWHELRGGSTTAVQVRQLTKAEIIEAAAVLKGVLSEETLKMMAERVKACETRFSEILKNTDYLPSEKDQASVALVLLCYKKEVPQKGQPESCRSRALAMV